MARVIRDPLGRDECAWRALWAEYGQGNGTPRDDAVTAHSWARLLAGDFALHARLAELDGRVVGFAHVQIHPTTARIGEDAYLEDLFVAHEARGLGIGRALMDDLVERCRAHGWGRLSWHCKSDNFVARALYDSYEPAQPLVRYSLTFGVTGEVDFGPPRRPER